MSEDKDTKDTEDTHPRILPYHKHIRATVFGCMGREVENSDQAYIEIPIYTRKRLHRLQKTLKTLSDVYYPVDSTNPSRK
jgi:hypothetical protein